MAESTSEEPSVYVLGYSPNNDTVWGIYTTAEAVEQAREALGRKEREPGPVGWVEVVPLRSTGSLPDEPFVG